jgi:hypothetical protein
MNRHTNRFATWLNSSEEDKYAEWSTAVLKLGIGLDYPTWCQLHEAELRVAAGIEENLNAAV